MKRDIPRFNLGARILIVAMLLLSMSALHGCAPSTVVVLQGEEIKKMDDGWLISDSALAELVECCELCTSVTSE